MNIANLLQNSGRKFVWGQLLIVLAVFMRVIIPQGFMLGEGSQSQSGNTISIILCTAQGELPATINANGEINFDGEAPSNHENEKNGANSHCTFASALSDVSFSGANHEFVAANWDYAFSQSKFIVPQIGLGLAAPPPPKTGPPILV